MSFGVKGTLCRHELHPDTSLADCRESGDALTTFDLALIDGVHDRFTELFRDNDVGHLRVSRHLLVLRGRSPSRRHQSEQRIPRVSPADGPLRHVWEMHPPRMMRNSVETSRPRSNPIPRWKQRRRVGWSSRSPSCTPRHRTGVSRCVISAMGADSRQL